MSSQIKHFLLFFRSIGSFYQNNRQSLLAGFLVLIVYGFSFIPVLAPGIDQPTAIGPYLNNAFPRNAPSGSSGNWMVENAFPKLTFPDPLALLEIQNENSYYVVSKTGQVWQFANDPETSSKNAVLDISPMVDTDGDTGLLNGVLHPEFGQPGSPNRGYIYLYYRYHPDGNVPDCETGAFLRLSRFNRPDGSANFDPNSELVLIQTFDEMCWHGGGAMFFDAEGYLYLATGDAGGINDIYQTTQKINERFFGGLLRLDVDKNPDRSHPIRRQQVDPDYMSFTTESSYAQGYYIPNDNPWQDESGAVLEEFYAIGLRSPHRATIDPVTGKIWVGDVGQGLREEISIIPKGGNLQWPFREGFVKGDLSAPDPLIGISTPPIYDYSHEMGNSIIGGFVYRGDNYQGALNGQYIFGDHEVRNVWTYNPVNQEVSFLVNVPEGGVGEKRGISSFATNSSGEIFVLKLFGTDLDGGVVYKLKQGADVPEPPKLLSQTGAFSDLTTLTPAPGIVPYTVNAPLWSDRAEKKRWIALPNDGTHNTADEQITFSATGNWQFPSGTVFIKHFELPLDYNHPEVTRRLETRFLVIPEDGGAYGVTYKWNDEGTDAELLVNGVTQDLPVIFPNGVKGTQTWKYPSRTDCMTCHNANADFVLGVHTWQLNGNLTYPSGITDNQLNTWNHLGMFANPLNPAEIPSLLKSVNIHDDSAPLGARVRSYLDANCSHCHRPNGVEGAFDARFATPLTDQNILWTFGASRNTPKTHYVVKPKDTSESEIWIRDSNLGGNAMPPLGKNVLDETYLDVLAEWINSLDEEACTEKPVSTLSWLKAETSNAFVELNTSIGSEQPNDGLPISINGRKFTLGLGVHAYSKVTYQTFGDYAAFQSYVGVDDEVAQCNDASVIFEVYADDELVAQSPLMKGGEDAFLLKADIQGAEQVSLVVTGGPDGEACDHADWADPRFLPCADCVPNGACNDGDPCTINDTFDADCHCAGTLQDSDGDGICDAEDQCPGFNDTVDTDGDGIPDGCDQCNGLEGKPCDDGNACTIGDVYSANCKCEGILQDSDGDGICDTEDQCPGFNDTVDTDGDGIPDGCDDEVIPCETTYLSDLEWKNTPKNAYGPMRKDRSADGNTMTVNGRTYERGLGAHSYSEVVFRLGGKYTNFHSLIGVDDETDCALGSVIFKVYTDGNLVFTSAMKKFGEDPTPISIVVSKVNELKLVTTIGNETDYCDHADWINARLEDCDECLVGTPCDDGNECTIEDRYDQDCNCVGILADADEDGVCDAEDVCPGSDDSVDVNNNGIPDGCDSCILQAGTPCDDGDPCTVEDRFDNNCHCAGTLADSDEDGVCDAEDACPGSDDSVDVNNNGIPDGCDSCILQAGTPCDDGDPCTVEDRFDSNCHCAGTLADSDEDGVCDAEDVCPGSDDSIDLDNNGVPDGCDTSSSKLPSVSKPALQVFRNIVSTELIIQFKLKQLTTVRIILLDQNGQVVSTLLAPSQKPAGTYRLSWPADLPDGTYIVQLQYPGGIVQEKIALVAKVATSKALTQKELSVTVWPNPFHNEFKLFIAPPYQELKRAVIRIMDVNGRIIYQKLDAPFNEEITIQPHSGWVNGIYLMQIHASDYNFSYTIIKQ